MCQTKALPAQYQFLTKSLIPAIIKLLSDDPVSVDAPQILGIYFIYLIVCLIRINPFSFLSFVSFPLFLISSID